MKKNKKAQPYYTVPVYNNRIAAGAHIFSENNINQKNLCKKKIKKIKMWKKSFKNTQTYGYMVDDKQ